MTKPDPPDATSTGAENVPPVRGSPADRGSTRTVVEEGDALRLPHERDESSDSGTAEPSEVMHQAAHDMDVGHSDEPRGPAAQRHYSELTAAGTLAGRARPGERPDPEQPASGAAPARQTGLARPPDAAKLKKKTAILERARADHAIKGEPTSGLPDQAERTRAEDVPPPQGQTDQTR